MPPVPGKFWNVVGVRYGTAVKLPTFGDEALVGRPRLDNAVAAATTSDPERVGREQSLRRVAGVM